MQGRANTEAAAVRAGNCGWGAQWRWVRGWGWAIGRRAGEQRRSRTRVPATQGNYGIGAGQRAGRAGDAATVIRAPRPSRARAAAHVAQQRRVETVRMGNGGWPGVAAWRVQGRGAGAAGGLGQGERLVGSMAAQEQDEWPSSARGCSAVEGRGSRAGCRGWRPRSALQPSRPRGGAGAAARSPGGAGAWASCLALGDSLPATTRLSNPERKA